MDRREETHRFPRRCEVLHDHILQRWLLSNVGKPCVPLSGHLRGIVIVLREGLDQRLRLPELVQ